MFINTPNNFSSMWGELNFQYNSDAEGDLLIEIINDSDDTVIGVKKFYSTATAQINIAPILFDLMMPQVQYISYTSIGVPSSGFPQIRLEAEGEQSESRIFTYSKADIDAPAILTTIPSTRILNGNEWDQVSLVAPEGTIVRYELYGRASGASGYNIISAVVTSDNGGARNFHINADDYSQTYEAIRVDFYVDDSKVDSINYTINAESNSGYRVAWLSSKGSIESYTFPVISEHVHLSSGDDQKTLCSAYGTQSEIVALSEIISSPKVWHVEGEEFSEITVITTEQTIRKDGALWIANIKIQENG